MSKRPWGHLQRFFSPALIYNTVVAIRLQNFPDSVAADLAAELKITKKQLHVCREIQKLGEVWMDGDSEERGRLYRLMVKRRLNKELEGSWEGDKAAKKKILQEMYEEAEKSYMKIARVRGTVV